MDIGPGFSAWVENLCCGMYIFFSKMAFYKEGEKTGRFLARIARSHQSCPAIGTIRTSDGHIVNRPDLITQELTQFYVTLYQLQSQNHGGTARISEYSETTYIDEKSAV